MKRGLALSGALSAALFLLHDLVGSLLWREYNPLSTYVSALTADEAPNASLLRVLLGGSCALLALFMLALAIGSLKSRHKSIPVSYFVLFGMSAASLLGLGLFPLTVNAVFDLKNAAHVAVALCAVASTSLALFALAFGFLRARAPFGEVALGAAMVFAVFNLLHLLGIVTASGNLGLLQRLAIYTFYGWAAALSALAFCAETGRLVVGR